MLSARARYLSSQHWIRPKIYPIFRDIQHFLPHEWLDDRKKAIFQFGMTTQDFADRPENYHSYYPMGVYMCFFLTPARIKWDKDKEKTTKEM